MLEQAAIPDDILAQVVDDYEEAPWLVMADVQGWTVNHFASTLETYVVRHQLSWTVATLLPVTYWSQRAGGRKVVSPDAFMAPVARRRRLSYDVEREGVPPAFVLEVVSPDSVYRDTVEKRAIYEEMGVREYALFGPPVGDDAVAWSPAGEQTLRRLRTRRRRSRRLPIEPPLQGWRRDEDSQRLIPWEPDVQGRLWSQELGLWLVVRGDEVGLQLPEGEWLPTHEEEAEARRRAEARAVQEGQIRAQEAEARAQEAEARRAAEAEVERLRQELDALRRQLETSDGDDRSACGT